MSEKQQTAAALFKKQFLARRKGPAQPNIILYLVRYPMLTSILNMVPQVVIQDFLMQNGASFSQIGTLGTFNNVFSALGMFLFAGMADRFKRFSSFKRAIGIAVLSYLINNTALIILSFCTGILDAAVVFWIYVGASVLQSLAVSISGLLEVTTILRVTNNQARLGRIMGIGGIGAGLAGILCGWVVKTVKGAFPLSQSIRILCFASMALTVITSALGFFFVNVQTQEIRSNQPVTNPFKVFREVQKMPQFWKLQPANIFRALQFMAVYFIGITGLQRFPEDVGLVGTLPIALTAANFLGCLLITYVHPRLGSGKMYGIGAGFAAVGFLIALVSRQSTVFLAGYFVLYLGQALIDFCFPLGIYDMVEADKVGQFSAARSLLYTVAVAAFVYLGGLLLDMVGDSFLCCIGISAALLSGGLYLWSYRRCGGEKSGHA